MMWGLSQLTEHIQDIITMHESTLSNYNTFCKNTYSIVYYHVYNDPIYMLHVLNFMDCTQFGLYIISKISEGHYQKDAVTLTFHMCLIFYSSF